MIIWVRKATISMTLIEKPSELDIFWSPVKVVTAEHGADTEVTAQNGADTEMQNPFKIKKKFSVEECIRKGRVNPCWTLNLTHLSNHGKENGWNLLLAKRDLQCCGIIPIVGYADCFKWLFAIQQCWNIYERKLWLTEHWPMYFRFVVIFFWLAKWSCKRKIVQWREKNLLAQKWQTFSWLERKDYRTNILKSK